MSMEGKNESKHTPGPYVIKNEGHYFRSPAVFGLGGKQLMASVYGANHDELSVNADLFASAPALLEENERLKKEVDEAKVLNAQLRHYVLQRDKEVRELTAEVDRLTKEKSEVRDYLLNKIEQRMIDNGVQEVRRDMSIAELAIREESRWMASIIKDLFSPA